MSIIIMQLFRIGISNAIETLEKNQKRLLWDKVSFFVRQQNANVEYSLGIIGQEQWIGARNEQNRKEVVFEW